MFGYVVANSAKLTAEQVERYRSVYCGLCRSIARRHGQHARLSLTYDLTFLVLLLDSLEEPEQRRGENCCPAHPFKPQNWRESEWSEYAADMNVALAYYKCLDDWEDDKNAAKLAYAQSLKGAVERIAKRWPEQCALMEKSLAALGELERERSADLDRASAAFGALMAELFAAPGGFFEPQLRELGEGLGRFIYVMDGVLDEEADAKKGRWNPVTRFQEEQGSFEALPTLEVLLGTGTMAFEQLPLEQDLDLLRNILYSGVWGQWVKKHRNESDRRSER